MKKFISGSVLILSLILAGCSATPMNYTPAYIAGDVASTKIGGAAYLIIDKDSQAATFQGNPTSYTGAALQIIVPLGDFSREIGLKILNTAFDGGVTMEVASKEGRYNIKTDLRNFSYKFDQLSNLGFAITPKVSLELHAVVTDANGKVLLEKNYTKVDFKGETYAAAIEPMQKMNMTIHKAVAECYKELAKDTADAINKNS